MATKWSSTSLLIIICILDITINVSLSDVAPDLIADEVNPIHYPDPQCYNSELELENQRVLLILIVIQRIYN